MNYEISSSFFSHCEMYVISTVVISHCRKYGDVMARDSQASAGYWEIVQDALADVVRVMLSRCFDAEKYPQLAAHCRNLRGELWVCAFPNLFVTVAPAEWKFQMPYFIHAYINWVVGGAYIMSLHMSTE